MSNETELYFEKAKIVLEGVSEGKAWIGIQTIFSENPDSEFIYTKKISYRLTDDNECLLVERTETINGDAQDFKKEKRK